MASCVIKLRLHDEGRAFAPGETIRGEVVVTTGGAVRCEGLRVRLLWRTSGKGNVDEGVCAEDPLEANAAWEAGERVYPFSLHVPEGPPAYEGELLQVSHVVVASADVPWAIDPKDERAVTLPGDGRWRSAAGNRPMVAGSQGSSVEIARKVLLGVLICVFVPFGLLFLPLVLAVMFPPTRNWLARQRLGEVSAGMDLQRGSPGQPLSVWVRAPRAGSLIRVVEATLRCDEVAIAGTGKHKTTHSRIPHQVVTTLARETDGTYHGALVIPPTTAWSFESNFNRVEWSLVVQGRVAGWVDWIVRFPISVDPPSAIAAAPPRLAAAPVVEPIAPAPEPITPAPVVEPSPAPLPPAPVAPPAGDEAALAALSQALKAASPLNDQRATLIQRAAAAPVTFTLRAERIERSFGLHLPPTHRDGRTAIGTLDDGTPVAVSLQDADTANAEALPRGVRLQVTATVTGWNSLFDRLELVGALT